MNKYFKFMTAALAVTALASCSEKLDFEQQAVSSLKEGDMVATLAPFSEEANTRVGIIPGGQVVWAEDDEVRVYSLDKLTFNSYVLDENQPAGQGAGYATAVMKEDIIQDKTSKNDYAVAQPKSNKDVRISSSDEGNALLQAKIPSEYEWATVQDAGTAYKVPSQYWGKVSSIKPFSCEFHALTAFIKLDLKDLPAGTNSIMVTTHEDFTLNHAPVVGGENEPISGNFEAELIDETSALQVSEDLTTKDYFRINFEASDADEDKILYIPVIAQTYTKLYVIAVKEYGKDVYEINDGEILKVWENEEFKVNVAKAASLGAEVEYTGTDPMELSKLIVDNSDGKHTARIRVTNTLNAGRIYILSDVAKNNVQITFDKVQSNALEITEAPLKSSSFGASFDVDKRATAETANGAKERTVSLKFRAGSTGKFDIFLPTSYVDLNTERQFSGEIDILAAKSELSKPLSPVRNVEAGTTSANNAKDAPITIHTTSAALISFDKVLVLGNSVSSAIYVFNPETEIKELGIACKNPGNVRITDALVKKLAYETMIGGADITLNMNSNVFTDGSAAISQLKGSGNMVKVQADWTGKGLTKEAIVAGYDQEEVYTAAQLQSMGIAAGNKENGGSLGATAVYKYKIADDVTDMWLGGKSYRWFGPTFELYNDDLLPLPGYLTKDVEFDGNFKGLYNMKLNINDPYFDSPHWCCTTCGKYEVKVEKDLGLIRGIYTTETATIKNVRLNDVDINTEGYAIPNVGSLAGTINANGNVTLANNHTTNVRIQNVGKKFAGGGQVLGNAGGQVGYVLSGKNVSLKNSQVLVKNSETNVDKTYVKTVGNNAGGFIGLCSAYNGLFEADNNRVTLDEVSADKGSNVGGIGGQVAYGITNSIVSKATVNIDVLKATENAKEATNMTQLNITSGNNVGGLIGYLWNENLDEDAGNVFRISENVSVNAKTEINAGNQYAGGLIGKLRMLADGKNDKAKNKTALCIAETESVEHNVSVTVGTLKAFNGFAGGLVGRNVSGDVVIINEVADKPGVVKVQINSLETAFAGAGVIGENNDRVWIKCDDKDDALEVTVSGWKNTWERSYFKSGYAAMSSATLNKLAGTFAQMLGHMNDEFRIWKTKVSPVAKANLIDDKNIKKQVLYFDEHTDATNTEGVATDKYWGDTEGFVGFSNKTGEYWLNGEKHADQLYNYRKNY